MIHDRHGPSEQALRAFLRERRIRADIRQAELAAKLGVPQSFVSKYESGERFLTFLETLAILRVLETSVDELVDCLSNSDETKP